MCIRDRDNTSDANKPISNATQTALHGKFSATDGNALKQTIEDMPNLVAVSYTHLDVYKRQTIRDAKWNGTAIEDNTTAGLGNTPIYLWLEENWFGPTAIPVSYTHLR